MQLIDALTALHGNDNLNITIKDSAEVDLITFKAPGYESIESDMGTRDVIKIQVDSGNALSISIADAVGG